VPKTVCEKVAAVAGAKKKRDNDVTNELIKKVTDHARHCGPSAAAKKFDVSQSQAWKWHEAFKKSDFKIYSTVQKRGRSSVLSEFEQTECLKYIDATRNTFKEQLTSSVVSAAAQGVVMQSGAARLKDNGGTLILGKTWANKFMKRHKMGKYAATTNRTVPSSEIAKQGPPFYKAISDTKVPMSLTFNVDEFFCLLSGSTKRWTWHRCSASRAVPLRETKLGFTMSVLTSADGHLHNMQMIWQGKTERSCAEAVTPDDRIWQCFREDSHFQNAETWSTWMTKFIEVVVEQRKRLDLNVDVPACLIADAAPQHAVTTQQAELLKKHNIYLVQVPDKMTHCFQPADQFIIKTIKEKMTQSFLRYIRVVVAAYGVNKAVCEIYTNCCTHLRKVKYELLRQAISNTPSSVIVKSWEESGILRESFKIATTRDLPFDIFCAEAGEVTVVISDDDERSRRRKKSTLTTRQAPMKKMSMTKNLCQSVLSSLQKTLCLMFPLSS